MFQAGLLKILSETYNLTRGDVLMKDQKIRTMTVTAMFTAIIVVMTTCFQIRTVNDGYIHFGDGLIYLAATILPMPYAMLAGAIGGGLADLLTAPAWTVATVIIKSLIVIPFTNKAATILSKRNIAAPIISYFISATGY